jgi:homoserine dehydrogenase
MADPVHDETVRVGLLGCGHVGASLVRLLEDNADLIRQRAGVHLEVGRVAVRDLARERDVPLPANRFTDDGEAVVTDPDIDIVVEVIGGSSPPAR